MTVTVRSIIATAAVAIMAAVILLTAGTSGRTPEPQRARYTGDLTSEAGTPIGTDDRMLNGAGSHGANVVTNNEGVAVVTADGQTIVVAWDATEDCTVLPASARSDRCELLTDY